jgi:hypothetical protein
MLTQLFVRTLIPAFRLLLITLVCLGVAACGNSEDTGTKDDDVASADDTQEMTGKEDISDVVPPGWTTAEFNDCTYAVPPDWNGDADAGVWWPGEGSVEMGRPPVSLHTGGIPLVGGASFEDRINTRMGGDPETRTDHTVAGMNAVTCTWTAHQRRYIGIFVKEEVSPGVAIAHFLDCRAPESEFENYEEVFTKIIASFRPHP